MNNVHKQLSRAKVGYTSIESSSVTLSLKCDLSTSSSAVLTCGNKGDSS